MLIYVQYDTNLKSIQIHKRKLVGQMYQQIVDELDIELEHVVYMIHNGEVVGLANLNFDKTLMSSGFHEKSLVHVVINHYPGLVLLSGNTTCAIFKKWNYRQTHNVEAYHLQFDEIVNQVGTRHRTYRNARAHAHTHRPIRNRNESTTVPVPTPVTVAQRRRVISTRQSDTESSDSEESDSHDQRREDMYHMVSNMLYPLTNIEVLLGVDVGEYISNLNLTDVPVTLTSEQISTLQTKKYKDIIVDYQSTHDNEDPYDKCPITQNQLNDESVVIYLECGHYFSEEGIKQWLSTYSTKCPCCNADVREFLNRRGESSTE